MRQTEIGSFRSFFLFFPSKNKKKKKQKNQKNEKKLLEISSFWTRVPNITIIWYMVTEIQSETDIFFCHFGPIFVFSPTTIPKIKFWKNERNVLAYYPFTHMYHINEDYMALAKKDNFLSFLVIFCPFTPLTIHKIRILKKWKTHLEILSFYTSAP